MRRKSSTLDDLEDHWQPVRSAILASERQLGFLCGIKLNRQTFIKLRLRYTVQVTRGPTHCDSADANTIYTVSQKTSHFVIVYIFAKINHISKFFHWYILWKISSKVIIEYPATR